MQIKTMLSDVRLPCLHTYTFIFTCTDAVLTAQSSFWLFVMVQGHVVNTNTPCSLYEIEQEQGGKVACFSWPRWRLQDKPGQTVKSSFRWIYPAIQFETDVCKLSSHVDIPYVRIPHAWRQANLSAGPFHWDDDLDLRFCWPYRHGKSRIFVQDLRYYLSTYTALPLPSLLLLL